MRVIRRGSQSRTIAPWAGARYAKARPRKIAATAHSASPVMIHRRRRESGTIHAAPAMIVAKPPWIHSAVRIRCNDVSHSDESRLRLVYQQAEPRKQDSERELRRELELARRVDRRPDGA